MVMVLMAVSVTVWVSGGGAAGGRIGHSAGGALAAVFGEIGEQVVHGGKSPPGQHNSAPGPPAPPVRLGKLPPMKRQPLWREGQLAGQRPGRPGPAGRHDPR